MLKAMLAALVAATTMAAPATAQKDPPGLYTPKPYVTLHHPAWSKDAILYQINTRQFTPEGNFAAAEKQLPRLKAMGVDIIWLMPINPIGKVNRKGTLGSPYAVRDYRAVNPEFGTLADLKRFVATAHGLGMHVILDWVANHTAWDNPMHDQHPDWYARDWKGKERPTLWWDWSDVIDLNYASPGLRKYMTESMEYWVRQADVDGFRCDVAGYVPLDFWETARGQLDKIKPVFMLAEFDQRDVHRKAFDATYAWKWNNAMSEIGMGKAKVPALFIYYSENNGAFPPEAQRMTYTENHDQNAWEGTEFERFGPALNDAIVLSFVGDGIPSIYNGQEAGNPKRLAFFEKDPIAWRDHPNAALFTKLIAFRKAHPALANAPWGAKMVPVVNTAPDDVLSFVREKDGDKVLAVFNLSAKPQSVRFTDGPTEGRYRDFADGAAVNVGKGTALTLAPWSYRVLATGTR